MFLSVKKVVCVHVCLHVLCFVRTVRNLKPHSRSAAWTDVLILLTDGINCVYRVSTFGQCVMNCTQNRGNVRHQQGFYLQRRLSVHSVMSRALEHLPCHSQTLFFPHLQPHESVVAWFSLFFSPDLLLSCPQNSRRQALALWLSFLVCIFNCSSCSIISPLQLSGLTQPSCVESRAERSLFLLQPVFSVRNVQFLRKLSQVEA